MNIRLHKSSATQAVMDSLKERIRRCEFGPGDKLPREQLLLKEYNVSRFNPFVDHFLLNII